MDLPRTNLEWFSWHSEFLKNEIQNDRVIDFMVCWKDNQGQIKFSCSGHMSILNQIELMKQGIENLNELLALGLK